MKGYSKLRTFSVILYVATVICFVLFFCYVGSRENISLFSDRHGHEYGAVTTMTKEVIPDETAPAEIRVRYQWTLDEAQNDGDCLCFYLSHHCVEVINLARELIQIADRYAVPHSALGLEITEREQETDAQQLMEKLKQLKAAGFRIILDDYGNGVTSESDLMNYPLDIVKIDRSLLLNTCTERGNAEFRALVAKTTQLGAEVVCEGIETEEQDRFVRDAGCHYGQGFLYFRPAAQNQVFEMMRKSSILEEDA